MNLDALFGADPHLWGLAAIVAITTVAIVSIWLPRHGAREDVGQALEGTPTQQSLVSFAKHRPLTLSLGAIAGVLFSLGGWSWTPDGQPFLPNAWVRRDFANRKERPHFADLKIQIILTIPSVLILVAKPQDRFQVGLAGAASVIILAALAIFPGDEVRKDGISPFHQILAFLVVLVALFGFLSYPRHPDRFVGSKLVDRQSTCSLLELATLSWSRATFQTTNIDEVGITTLPALPYPARARQLVVKHANDACITRGGLKYALAKRHARALAGQWTLTVIKHLAALAPRLVMLRFLDRLSTSSLALDYQGVWLGLSLGLSKALELWLDAWLQWITASKLQIPIQATLSSLVYAKTLRLPSVTTLPQKDHTKFSATSAISRMRSDR